MAIVSPLAAKAQTPGMTLGITTNPLGQGYQSSVFIDPYDTSTLYVYATVTGTTAPSPTYVDGLNYAYFNVQGIETGVSGLGNITAATPSSLFGGGNFNQTTNNPGAGAQGGALPLSLSTTASIVVGSNTSIGSVAKPRSSSDIFYNGTPGSYTVGSTGSTFTTAASNIVVNGNSVSFLLETLTYTPTTSAFLANPTTKAAPNTVSFNVSMPASSMFAPATNYVGSNYFYGLPGTPGTGSFNSSPGILGDTTQSTYTASTSSVSLTDALPGDFNLDGSVGLLDLGALQHDFGVNSGATFATGDWNGDGAVGLVDLGALSFDFGASLTGLGPANLTFGQALSQAEAASPAFAAAVSSVPEPASIGLVGIAGFVALTRRRTKLDSK
jgi:hypothetical protein